MLLKSAISGKLGIVHGQSERGRLGAKMVRAKFSFNMAAMAVLLLEFLSVSKPNI